MFTPIVALIMGILGIALGIQAAYQARNFGSIGWFLLSAFELATGAFLVSASLVQLL